MDERRTARKEADERMVEGLWVCVGVDVSRMESAKDNVSND